MFARCYPSLAFVLPLSSEEGWQGRKGSLRLELHTETDSRHVESVSGMWDNACWNENEITRWVLPLPQRKKRKNRWRASQRSRNVVSSVSAAVCPLLHPLLHPRFSSPWHNGAAQGASLRLCLLHAAPQAPASAHRVPAGVAFQNSWNYFQREEKCAK